VALNAGGFVTSMHATSLSWSTRGQLREVQEPVPAELEHYGYDADLRRTSRHRGTTTEFYVHEGPNRIAVISPGAGAGVGVGALVQGFLFDGIDHPLRVRIPGVGGPAGTTAYYEVDLAGNVRALRASGGASLGTYRYSAFGRTLEDTSSVVQPLRWKGMWHLEVGGTELYDARARVWSPALGSFLAVDEFVFVDRTNTLWAWPNQNPIRFSDPSGHSQPPGGRLDVGLFTSNQINSIFDASGQAAYAASQNWDAGNYATAAFHFSGSISLFEAGIAASLLARRPATSADFAMMACPIDIPAGGAAGAAEAAAADAAIAGHAAKHWPKLSPEQLAAKIAEVRQTGTSIVAPNGNMLTHVKDGTVLVENPATGEAGTIFKPDNTRDFINRWLSENP
jgi:RHS repeat-associated protein